MSDALWPLLPETIGDALFICEDHRLWLERRWAGAGDDALYALHLGMNPSKAGARNDDLTVRKDQEFTRRMGLSRMFKANAGTFISTDPMGLLAAGIMLAHPDNLPTILRLAAGAARIIVATGRPPDPLVVHARAMFRALRGLRLECFGLTKDHWPKHSSRLGYDTPLVEFVW
jgi:hypothetical protein